jgi:integrase
MALTDVEVKKAELRDKDYKLSDAGGCSGLYVLVKPSGAKYWRLKYRIAGKEKLMPIGVYPAVSLKDARLKAQEAKLLIASGVDPMVQRKAEKLGLLGASENTFEAAATAWFEMISPEWSSSHKERTQYLIKNHLLPWIGNRPLHEITPPELLAALHKAQNRGLLETARRAKQTASQIFRHAIRMGKLTSDPSRDLSGGLTTPKPKSFSAITEPKAAGALMLDISHYQSTPAVKAALQLSALLFQRPGEIRSMLWADIDWEASEWRYLVTKTQTPHIVPLAKQALEILQELKPYTERSIYVFPSARGASRPMSENAIRVALRSMGYTNDQMTAHGFRAMARTILDEVLGVPAEFIEHQLAHKVKDALGTAYNRTKHLSQRKDMMQKWADYLDVLKMQAKGGSVIAGTFNKHA